MFYKIFISGKYINIYTKLVVRNVFYVCFILLLYDVFINGRNGSRLSNELLLLWNYILLILT